MTNATARTLFLIGAIVAAFAGSTAAQSSSAVLGTVQLGRSLLANGQKLPPGTYQVRLSGDTVTPVAGQADSETWVDFVRGGKVAGRELASVVADADIKSVAKGAGIGPGQTRVEMLKDGQYWRVWLRKGANHYLIHLPPAP
jgi:hypothetical protein